MERVERATACRGEGEDQGEDEDGDEHEERAPRVATGRGGRRLARRGKES